MRLRALGLLLPLWSVGAFFACSMSPTTSTSSSSGTTGTGGAPNCDGLWFAWGGDGDTDCDRCAREKCCAELAACGTDHCLLCSTLGGQVCCGGGGGCGDVDPQWRITRRCASEKCQPECFPTCFPPHCPDGGDGG